MAPIVSPSPIANGTEEGRLQAPRGNLGKYTSRNLLQQLLIRRFLARIDRILAGLPGGPLLDAGCGEGFVLARLLDGRWVVGVDLDEGALHFARRQAPAAGLARASLLRLPFAPGSFPVLLCLEVLEHLPRPREGVAELHRVSAGHLVASVPHEPWFRLANLLRGKNLDRWGDDPEHLNHWGPEGFRRLLEEQFREVKLEASVPWLIAVARR